ncbi:MAG: molybdopterin-dependent oxidoreductase [Pseudonocardia sp.]
MPRPGTGTNLALLALVLVTFGTGVLAFGVGTVGPARWLVVTHGCAGFAVLLLAPWKSVIARRGLRRPGISRRLSSLAMVALLALCIGSGVLHAVGGFRGYLGLLPMQLHVGSAVAVGVLLAGHLRAQRGRQRFRPRRVDLPRRVALRSAGLATAAAAGYLLLPDRPRRATGSHEVGSGDPSAMPVTQWAFDPVPRLAAANWRLRAGERVLGLDELDALPQRTVRVVLDCTGGWYAEQEWRGVPVSALLPDAMSARAVEVLSVTGYRRLLPAGDLPVLLLATHAGGARLSAGHGGPARLVAPGRRGFWWVKWVVAVRPVGQPWWWQPPFPLR